MSTTCVAQGVSSTRRGRIRGTGRSVRDVYCDVLTSMACETRPTNFRVQRSFLVLCLCFLRGFLLSLSVSLPLSLTGSYECPISNGMSRRTHRFRVLELSAPRLNTPIGSFFYLKHQPADFIGMQACNLQNLPENYTMRYCV